MASTLAQVYLGLFLVTRLLGNNDLAVQTIALPALGAAAVLLAPANVVRRIPISLALTLFLTWMLFSYAWSIDIVVTLRELILRMPGLIVAWLCVGILPPARLRVVVLVSLSLVLALNVAYLAINPSVAMHPPPLDIAEGWRGLFGHKNAFGIFMLLTAIAYLTLLPRVIWRYVLLAGLSALIVAAQSVTALSTLLVVFAAYLWVYRYHEQETQRLRTAYAFTSGLLLVVGVTLLATSLGRFVGLFGRDITFTGRTRIWSAALDAIGDRPWLGYGWFAPWNSVKGPTIPMQRAIGFGAFSAHQGALEMMLALGAIGLALYLPLLFGVFRAGFRAMHVHQPYGRYVVLHALAILVASTSEPTFTAGGLFELLAILYAGALVIIVEERHRKPALNRG